MSLAARPINQGRPRIISWPVLGSRQPAGPRRGMVLYVVAVVVAMLSLAGLSYVTVLYTEDQAVRLHGDELEIECLVGSGAESIKAFCDLDREQQDAIGGGYDNPDLFRGVAVLDERLDGRGGRFSVISPRVENGEITGIRFGIENESTRLNLAVLPEWDEEYPGAGRKALMALPGMTESIADAILDWIDADGTRRPYGAEADYYNGLGVPYGPRNAVPTSLEELLLVRDVTRDLLFGADANFNYRLDAGEGRSSSAPFAGGASGAGLPWASLLTVFSAERNVSPDGNPRIDLNMPDMAALHQDLSDVFDEDWVNFIVAYRQFGPYRGDVNPDDYLDEDDAEDDDSPKRKMRIKRAAKVEIDFSRPGRFEMESVLDLVDAWVAMKEDGRRGKTLIQSPFVEGSGALRDDLPELLDWTTVRDEPILRGRINVNFAPRPVLAAVPGLDDVLVEQIVGARASRSDLLDPTWRHPTWLLTEGLVDLERMREALPYLTTGGDVYRAQVVGYFDAPGPPGRAELVVDATSSPPRQVYWKDLRLLGPGYPAEELGGEPSGDARRFSTGTGGFDR